MLRPPIPDDEARRLTALQSLSILDTPPEERFDRITRLVRRMLDVPIALVSLVDENRQWFKSRQGLDAEETPREVSFCGHAILDDVPLCIPDALEDARFADNPLVVGEPYLRFYVGCPLRTPDGSRVGTLCAIGREPRTLEPDDLECLADLAATVEREILAVSLATRDALTDLANRSSLEGVARRRLETPNRRHHGVDLSLLVFDLDLFKEINDGLGHTAGDMALRQFGSALRSSFRDCDVVARLGGDEFCVLFDGDLEGAEPPLHRLRRFIEVLNEARPIDYPIWYSVGGARFDSERHAGLAELFEDADRNMYAAKRKRRSGRSTPVS